MTESIEDALMHFIQTRMEKFTLPELLKVLGLQMNRDRHSELADYLTLNQLAYMDPAVDGSEASWITRFGLFTGKTVEIAPSRSELAAGVLVIGSRFVPIYNPSLLPHEMGFLYKGEPVPRTSLECNPEDVYPFYALFGEEYIPQFIAMDSEENNRLYTENDFYDPRELTVKALDMRAIYLEHQFSKGDRLRARVLDWNAGLFEIEVLKNDANDRLAWYRTLEDCLKQSFEIIGPSGSIEDQLAFAFFLGQEELFTEHAGSIEEFMEWTSAIGLESYGVESRLWLKGEEIPSVGTWGMCLINSPTTALEEAILYTGLPLSTSLIDVYIQDALFRRETATTSLFQRMIPPLNGNPLLFVPVIKKYVNRRFTLLGASYNRFADYDAGLLRTRFVTLHSALMYFVFLLERSGVQPQDLPEQGFVILGQLMSHTVNALDHFIGTPELSADESTSLFASVEGMEDSYFEIKTIIQEVLPEITKPRFSVPKTGEKKTDE